MGYGCSSNIGYDCQGEELYSENFGYALEDWQAMVVNCPASCGLLCGCVESTGVMQTFVNRGGTDTAVYFIVDGKKQTSSGNFTLGWQILKYASCDATELLPNAADIGDCQRDLPHGVTCHQIGMEDYTCSASTCQDGTLAEGRCYQTNYCSILTLEDSYGDGWDTGTLSFSNVETGRIIFSALTLSRGSSSTVELCFPCGCFIGQATGGRYPEEMFWSLHETVGNAMLIFGEADAPSESFCPVSSSCSRCSAGSFSNSAGTACESCTPGRYNGEEWSAVELCAECSPGRYNMNRGSTSETDCLHCAAGYYSPPGATDSLDCVPGTGGEDIGVLQSISDTLGVNIWDFSVDFAPTMEDVCESRMVTCDKSYSRITGIVAYGQIIGSELSSFAPLGKLKGLVILDLSGNSFTGELPKEWAALESIQELKLHENELSGTLPTEWASLRQLSVLTLFTNRLSGKLPTEWAALESMQRCRRNGHRFDNFQC